MIGDIFSVWLLAFAFLGVVAILWIIFEASESKPSKPKESSVAYACGTSPSPDELNVPSWSYYEYMKHFLRAEYLSRLHSGDLSTYMAWILIGMVLIFSVMVIMW